MKSANCIRMLNPKNIFESFVLGNNNNFAYAAALTVAENPGKSFNPLFLHGGTGIGKTHLLHAVGQYVSSVKIDAHVACLSAKKFTSEYIDSIQSKQLARFHEKYRQTDVLLIDDLQFLVGMSRSQKELFYVIRALCADRKQIVMAGNCAPGEVMELEQRLVSCFEWGLETSLQASERAPLLQFENPPKWGYVPREYALRPRLS